MVAFSRVIASTAIAMAMLTAPTWAQAAVLYDQTDHAGTPTADPNAMNFSPSNDLGAGVGADRTADDFPVPSGQTWSINEIDVGGAYFGAPPGTVNVFIYADAAGQPGAQLFGQSAITATGGPNYAVPLSGAPELTGGNYWITVQQAGAHPADNWSWTTRTVQSGQPAKWITNTASSPNCSMLNTWLTRTTCWPGNNPDQIFQLKGDVVTPPPPSNLFTLGKPKLNKKKGTATEPVTVPGSGDLSLSGKTRPVTGPGTTDLLIKAKGKAKKKLKRKGRAKVKVTITFTPTGGTSNSQTTTVKLKKKKRR
jgi:hypothetical protein